MNALFEVPAACSECGSQKIAWAISSTITGVVDGKIVCRYNPVFKLVWECLVCGKNEEIDNPQLDKVIVDEILSGNVLVLKREFDAQYDEEYD